MKVEFRRAALDGDGEPLFDLWIDNRPVESSLTIDEVLRRINQAEDRAPEGEARHD